MVHRRKVARQAWRGSIRKSSSRTMLENRNLKLDLLALGLLAVVIFLAAALFSYDPADPPTTLVFPAHAQAANVCGHWGALASRLLFEAFGLGAYYLLLSLAVFDAVLLTRRESQPAVAAADGWLLSLLGRDDAGRSGRARPLAGTGHRRRAAIWASSARRCCKRSSPASAPTSSTVSMIFGGLLLSTDYALVRLLRLGREAIRRAAWAAACCKSARPMPKSSHTSRDPISTISSRSSEDETLAVRMPGRRRQRARPLSDEREGSADDRTTKRAAEAERRPKDLRLAGRNQPAQARRAQKCSKKWTNPTSGRSTSDYELPSTRSVVGRRDVQLRRARKRGAAEGQNSRKDFRRLRLQHSRGGDSDRAGHRPVRGRVGGRPAAEPASPAWPTIWPSPCACRACASWPRCPARTRSASKCPTTSGNSSASAR